MNEQIGICVDKCSFRMNVGAFSSTPTPNMGAPFIMSELLRKLDINVLPIHNSVRVVKADLTGRLGNDVLTKAIVPCAL